MVSAFVAWEKLEQGSNIGGLIDDHLQQHAAKAAKKWRDS